LLAQVISVIFFCPETECEREARGFEGTALSMLNNINDEAPVA